MRQSDKRAIAQMLHEMIDAERGAAEMADNLGKSYSTLMAEINGLYAPADSPSHNKLGLVTALEIMEDAGAETLLEWQNRRFGYLPPVPLPAIPPTGEALHATMTRIAEEIGEVAGTLREITDPGSAAGSGITPEERAELATRIREAAAVLLQLDVNAAAVVVGRIGERRRG